MAYTVPPVPPLDKTNSLYTSYHDYNTTTEATNPDFNIVDPKLEKAFKRADQDLARGLLTPERYAEILQLSMMNGKTIGDKIDPSRLMHELHAEEKNHHNKPMVPASKDALDAIKAGQDALKNGSISEPQLIDMMESAITNNAFDPAKFNSLLDNALNGTDSTTDQAVIDALSQGLEDVRNGYLNAADLKNDIAAATTNGVLDTQALSDALAQAEQAGVQYQPSQEEQDLIDRLEGDLQDGVITSDQLTQALQTTLPDGTLDIDNVNAMLDTWEANYNPNNCGPNNYDQNYYNPSDGSSLADKIQKLLQEFRDGKITEEQLKNGVHAAEAAA